MSDVATEEWEKETYDCLEQMASSPPALPGNPRSAFDEADAPLEARGRFDDAAREAGEIDLGCWAPRLA